MQVVREDRGSSRIEPLIPELERINDINDDRQGDMADEEWDEVMREIFCED